MVTPQLLAVLPVVLAGTAQADGTVTLNAAEFRDRVYACWLGKSIGGTLGMPVEGQRETHNFTFFTPVPEEPAANDDLDLQLLWLKALEERGPFLDARDLGEYWLSYVPVDWGEYGICKANMRAGFPPPLSGHIRNRWRDSNGAWIRSEIWACVAPGCPDLAARYAYEDACVDHGGGEGTYAEVFTAVVESAAFVESDPDRLIAIGLSYIPEDCAVAASIRAALDAWASGLDLMAAREAVVQASASTGWFMAPQNVAFVVLGWKYGEGDFGKSLCAAVNCGDDTDCTGATLGSILGIISGTAGIPREWREPVGEGIRNIAVSGFDPPRDLTELTDRTVRMARQVLLANGAPVEIADTLPTRGSVSPASPGATEAFWRRSPYEIPCDLISVRAVLDVRADPEVAVGEPVRAELRLENTTPAPLLVDVAWRAQDGLTASPASARLELPPAGHGPVPLEVTIAADEVRRDTYRASVEIAPVGRPRVGVIPFALIGRVSVSRDDLALAERGARAMSDSELAYESGCTAKAIDGRIALPDGFEGARWHSALTPHPHWLAIELPAPARVGRVVVHFADPNGHPVDFRGEASLDGETWSVLFDEVGYAGDRMYERSFDTAELRWFRLTILRSSSERWPDAAQVSEIELLPG